MIVPIFATFFSGLLGWLMGFLSIFLILLILVQRGRGGGLAGALGGPGGQSAFGSKAGDTFTVITIVVAAVWGLVCAFTMWSLGTPATPLVDRPAVSPRPGDEPVEQDGGGLVVPTGDGLGGMPNMTAGDGLTGMELTPANELNTTTEPATNEDASPADDSTTPGDDSESVPATDATAPAADDSAPAASEPAPAASEPATDESPAADAPDAEPTTNGETPATPQ